MCRLAEISETYRVGERDALTAMREIRSRMISDLMRRLRLGKVTARNLESLRRAQFRARGWARTRLRAVIESIGAKGVTHVRDELRRQDAS